MHEIISAPWHWSVSGLLIAVVMFLLLFAGREFGVSGNLRTMCSLAGAGERYAFFRFDWRAQRWNLLFVGGAAIGGGIAYFLLPAPGPVDLADSTLAWLDRMGISRPGGTAGFTDYLPAELFAVDNLLTPLSLTVTVGGGFLIGFGTRWAGGCTSGHAISGLSNLQLPSLIAVIGFFVGGLLMNWLILPLILQA